MKHAQGPWAVQEYKDGRISILSDVKSDSAIVVADMVHTGHEKNQAHLIAAAPAMYEALLDLVICPAFNSQVFEKDKESHRAWTLARAALAQAEGRE